MARYVPSLPTPKPVGKPVDTPAVLAMRSHLAGMRKGIK